MVGGCFYFCQGIVHCDAGAAGLQHVYIVVVISKGSNLFHGNSVVGCQHFDAVGFGRLPIHDHCNLIFRKLQVQIVGDVRPEAVHVVQGVGFHQNFVCDEVFCLVEVLGFRIYDSGPGFFRGAVAVHDIIGFNGNPAVGMCLHDGRDNGSGGFDAAFPQQPVSRKDDNAVVENGGIVF